MKTAQEWLDTEQWHESGDNAILPQIAAIQIDALQEASDIAIKCSEGQVRTIPRVASEIEDLIKEIKTKYKLK